MKITKDEARILADALEGYKYSFSDSFSPEKSTKVYNALVKLQEKLEANGKDRRRVGRRSLDGFMDIIKRYSEI